MTKRAKMRANGKEPQYPTSAPSVGLHSVSGNHNSDTRNALNLRSTGMRHTVRLKAHRGDMMATPTKKNAVLIPILILFGANMILSAMNVTDWMAKDNFRTFSETTAIDLVREVRPKIDRAVSGLPADATPAQIKPVFDSIILSGSLVAYELYDRLGKPILFSSTPLAQTEERAGDPGIRLTEGRDRFSHSGSTSSYSHADFTLTDAGRISGHMRIFIDQKNALALFYTTNRKITIISVLFLAVAVALFTFIVWSRIREQWQADDEIRHLAHHDGLTDLPKREVFFENLTYAIGRAEPANGFVALLCLDIDNFKQINDTMGHATGDELLRLFAERLRENVRKSDLVCRMGGDEFAIALCGLKSADKIMPFATRLCDILSKPYPVDDREFTSSVSIGVAIAPKDSRDASTLFKCADLALYRSKEEGRNTVRFFETEMDVAFQRRLALEQELTAAIEGDQFVLYYQPQYDMHTGNLTGHEALVRWAHPTRGLVVPDEFIPIAEETGLIIPLSRWVFERACSDAVTWGQDLRLAINLSPIQFTAGSVVDLVTETAQKTGFPPNLLELEITESLLITNTDRVIEELGRLKRLGVRIVMDDFGTGYSSLSYLSRFPFDKIKIDRSFVSDLSKKPMVDVIVRTIIGLGHELDIIIAAEGIETRRQETILKSWGCDHGQGFLYGRPIAQYAGPAHDLPNSVDEETMIYPAKSA